MSASVNKDGDIEVKTPYGVSDKIVQEFLLSHEERLVQIIGKSALRREYEDSLGEGGLDRLEAKARAVIPERVKYYSSIMGVAPERVRINHAKTRFGSCSSKGNLNFSCRVMAYSEKAVDYVVIHELAHLLYMNHSREFWKVVEKYMPDYKIARQELKKIPDA